MEILVTNKRDMVLKFFLDAPTKEVHLRELSRQLFISFPWVRKIILTLVKEGYIIRKDERGLVLVKANRDNPLFLGLKRSYNLFSLFQEKIVEKLVEAYGRPEAIILYGSYSRGEDIEGSDIDIAVITTRKCTCSFSSIEKKLKRKIKILELERKNIEKEFVNTLSNGIVLYGYWEAV